MTDGDAVDDSLHNIYGKRFYNMISFGNVQRMRCSERAQSSMQSAVCSLVSQIQLLFEL